MNNLTGRLVASLILDTSKFEASMDKVNKKFAAGMASGKALSNMMLKISQDVSDTTRDVMGGAVDSTNKAGAAIQNNFVARLGAVLPILGKIQEASMKVALPLAAIGAMSVRAFSSFDQNIARVATSLRLSDPQRERLTGRVLDTATTTTTAPDELVRAYGQLSRAGMDSSRSLAILNDVNRFAVANNMEAADSARHLTSVQRELGMASQDATRDQANLNKIMDVITKTTMIANVTAEELLDSLGNRSAIGMRQLGMSLEQGAAVMGVFAEQGIRGTAAGQRFEMMLRELQIAATRHSEEWRRMGFSLYDAQGKFLPMSAIIHQLESAFRGASDEQRRYILQGLGFSDRTIQVVRSLIGFSTELQVYENQLRSANGVTQQAYDVYIKSFAAQMQILWNNIRVVGIEIGQVLAPWILRLNQGIRAAVDWWRKLSDPVKQVVFGFAAAFAIVGPLVWAFNFLVGGLWAFVAAAAPLALIGLILGIIGAAVLFVAEAIADPSGGWVGAWNSSIEAVQNFFAAIPGFLNNFVENMNILWTWFRENWWKVLADIGQVIALFVGNSLQIFGWFALFVVRLIGEMVAEVIRVIFRAFSNIPIIIWNALVITKDAFVWILQVIVTWGANVSAIIIDYVDSWRQAFADFFGKLPLMADVAARLVQIALRGGRRTVEDNIAMAALAGGGVERAARPAVPLRDYPNRPEFRGVMDGTGAPTTDFQGAWDRSFGMLANMPNFMDGFKALAEKWPELNLAFEETAKKMEDVEEGSRRMFPNIPGLGDETGLNPVAPLPRKPSKTGGKDEFQEMSFNRFILGNPSAAFDVNRKRPVADTVTHDKLDRLIDVSSRDRTAVAG